MKKKTNTTQHQAQEHSLTPHIDLLYQALETELGGVKIYTTALGCVQNEDLREEWEKYLKQTKNHVEIVRTALSQLGLDIDRESPGRQVVRHIGNALVDAMQMALRSAEPEAAEIVAAECVQLAETKDHANWSLIGKIVEQGSAKEKAALEAAHEKIEPEEDEHLYHTGGWARELWLDALGLEAELPPPEEEADVTSEEEAVEVKKKSFAQRGS
jgi:rubrerythrin